MTSYGKEHCYLTGIFEIAWIKQIKVICVVAKADDYKEYCCYSLMLVALQNMAECILNVNRLRSVIGFGVGAGANILARFAVSMYC